MAFPAGCYPKSQKPLSAGFDPLAVPSIGEWFDYRSVASVGDGNPVSDWVGRAGLYTASATGTERLTYVGNAGDGRGAALFDGVNDKPSFAGTNAALLGPDGYFEVWAVVKIPVAAVASTTLFQGGFDSGTSVAFIDNPASTRWYFTIGGQANYGNAEDTHDDAWHVLRFVSSSGGNDWSVDGVSVGVNTFGSFTWNDGASTFYIGGSAGDWNGMLRHLLTFKAPLDVDTAADLLSYLQTA